MFGIKGRGTVVTGRVERGMVETGQTIEIDPFPLYNGRQLVGTGGGETDPDVDFEKYCRMYLEGILKLDEMISHTFSLPDINKGVELMQEGKCLRVLIDMEKS